MLSAEDSLVLVIDIQEKLVNALEKDTIVSKASKIVESARILDIPVLFTEQYPKGLGQTVAKLLEDRRARGQEGKSLTVESGKLKVESLSSHAPSPDGEQICERTERSESGLRKDGAYCGEATNAELLEQRANSRQGWDGVISTSNREILQPQQFDTNLSTVQPFNPSTFEKTHFNALLEDGFLEKIKSYGKKQIVIMGIETHICVYQTACALVDEGFEVYAIKDACASRNKYEFKQGIEAMRDNGVKISCVEIALFEWLKGSKHPKFKEIQALIK